MWFIERSQGILYVAINKNGKKYHLFGTHTQADEGTNPESLQDDRKSRDEQLTQLSQFIASKNINKNEAVIVMGDINVDAALCQVKKDCSEFNFLLNTLNASFQAHSNIGLLPYLSNLTLDGMNTDPVLGSYDYILPLRDYQNPSAFQSHGLVLRGVENPKMYTGTPYGDTDLSDHFSLEAEIQYPAS